MKRFEVTSRSLPSVAILVLSVVLIVLLGVPGSAVAAGTRTLSEVTGVTRTRLVNWLESHRSDTYYLTTPYVGGDWRSPNGDASFNGAVGMNCTGFVWHAYTKAGASGIPGIVGWLDFIFDNDLIHYNYPTKQAMLASGVLEKGDVIWIWEGDMFAFNPYHHVGIFWGDTSSQDRFWHSHDSFGTNTISAIAGKGYASSFTVVKTENKGYIDLVKTSSKPQVTAGNSDFSLSGARFGVFATSSATGSPIASMTTNASGRATSPALAPGTYYVKETVAPMGFEVNPTIFRVSVTSGRTTRLGGAQGQVTDVPAKGWVELEKRSAWPQMSQDNDCYGLEGAVYAVFSDSACTAEVAVMVTDASGKATTDALDAGSYFVKETAPARGYALDEEVYPVVVRPKQTVKVNASVGYVTDRPQHNPLEIVVYKVDAETGQGQPQGAATLSDAHFEVCYYGGYQSLDDLSWTSSAVARKTWILRSDERGEVRLDPEHLVAGDELIQDASGRYTIGLGTVVIREIKAPLGYLVDKETRYACHITVDGVSETVSTYRAPSAADRIKRGDLDLIKASEGTYGRMGAVPFKITSLTTGESHTIVTDANGYASTASSFNPHGQNTNEGLTDIDGVWFGAREALDEGRGALPFDTYLIEELTCPTNIGRPLIAPFEIAISRDGHLVSIGTLLNQAPPVPSIATSAVDGTSQSKTVLTAGEAARIIDTVRFHNLMPSVTYELRGVLMDGATGQRLIVEGDEVWASCTFVSPEGAQLVSGVVELTFSFDASGLADRDLVVFEYLYSQDTLITTHEDITDSDQTVTLRAPRIRTSARDGASGTQHVVIGGTAMIIDTVTYEHLTPGQSYTLEAVLMDKVTGTPFMLESNEVTATTTFVAQGTHGTVEVTFSFPSAGLDGRELVVFERLFHAGVEIATHTDIEDRGQTVILVQAPTVPAVSREVSSPVSALPPTGDQPVIGMGAVALSLMGILGIVMEDAWRMGSVWPRTHRRHR